MIKRAEPKTQPDGHFDEWQEKSEQVLWTGRPIAWRLGIRRWPFAAIGLLMLYMTSKTLGILLRTDVAGSPVRAWAAWPMFAFVTAGFGLFWIISLGLIAQPFLMTWGAMQTRYAITDRRVLLVFTSRFRSSSMHEFGPGTIKRVVCLRGRRGAIGDILLFRGPIDFYSSASTPRGAVVSDWKRESGLLAIRNPDAPERLIRQLHLDPDEQSGITQSPSPPPSPSPYPPG